MADRIKLDAIADELAESAGLSKRMARAYAKFIFQSITEHLADGDSVLVPSFGKFDTAVFAPRRGRNINTGEQVTIPAKHKIKFEMSRSLLESFNAGRSGAENPDTYDE